ncbi:hypothetical protein AB0I16_34565 [Streptomyces sp. NPDC050703]|uniref:hypothetical protein n=1 Tax=Streptomyces sp. NPDC050703 TaxID=3157218 RepID=UPI003423C026
MRCSREETVPQDLPGDLWHALVQLQHTHPDAVGRVGPLARPAGLLSFTAAADTILAARVQLTGAGTMHEVNETLRAMTGNLPRAHFTGPGVALELTLGRRQDLPIHTAHTVGLTWLFHDATYTISDRDDAASGCCFHCDGDWARPLPVGAGPRGSLTGRGWVSRPERRLTHPAPGALRWCPPGWTSRPGSRGRRR